MPEFESQLQELKDLVGYPTYPPLPGEGVPAKPIVPLFQQIEQLEERQVGLAKTIYEQSVEIQNLRQELAKCSPH